MYDVIVLGSGMVGVSTALALQERGLDVGLLDRGDPAARSSYGNAGIIQVEAAEPYAMPRSMGELAAIALRRSNAVAWQATALPSMLRPLWGYFRNSSPLRHHLLAQTYSKLTSRATLDHAPWIAAADAENLIQRRGFLHAFSDGIAFGSAGSRAERLFQQYGVRFAVLDRGALKKLEPGLKKNMAGAIHWLDPWTCYDPGALVASYADLFRSRGGQFLLGDAMTLARVADAWHVKTFDGSKARTRQVVIAMGMQSAELCSRLGLRVPLFAKRGYHLHLKVKNGPLRPFVDVASSAVLAPMTSGLRVLTGAEIARAGVKTRPIQLERARQAAEELFDVGEPLDNAPWIGVRPCMPDMLPVLGALPGDEGLWANFGHGHQGFTLGPTTAQLLAAEMTGGAPVPHALSPNRRF